RQLVNDGKQVRAIVLDEKNARKSLPESAEVVGISPHDHSVQDACSDASIIFNCFEPHDREWISLSAEITSKVLLSAIQSGGKLVLASHLFRSESDNLTAERDVLDVERTKLGRALVVRFPQIYGPEVRN